MQRKSLIVGGVYAWRWSKYGVGKKVTVLSRAPWSKPERWTPPKPQTVDGITIETQWRPGPGTGVLVEHSDGKRVVVATREIISTWREYETEQQALRLEAEERKIRQAQRAARIKEAARYLDSLPDETAEIVQKATGQSQWVREDFHGQGYSYVSSEVTMSIVAFAEMVKALQVGDK